VQSAEHRNRHHSVIGAVVDVLFNQAAHPGLTQNNELVTLRYCEWGIQGHAPKHRPP
jgi:hypothetical protein